MLNLDNLTINFIENNYLDEDKQVIYAAFTLIDNFSKAYYEDPYIDMLTSDGVDQSDNFMAQLRSDIIQIIREHYIYLNLDNTPKLQELVEIASFLLLIQNLEGYDDVAYRLYADDSSINIISDLIEQYSLLPKYRVLELIDTVDDSLITVIKRFVEDKIKDTTTDVNLVRINSLKSFIKFIGETDCIGKQYYYFNLENIYLKDLELVTGIDISDTLEEKISVNRAGACLDILSLLLMCKDSYEVPILAFKKNYNLFLNKDEDLLKIEPTLIKMVGDFIDYRNNTSVN